ncbi:MAG: flagellar biosynthetic protein FliR [Phycisphaerae bacterium]|jgi:flagellar biosynthetic protein FliR
MDIGSLNSVWVYTTVLVMARCGGIFLVAPVFAHPAVPVRLRVAMSLVVGLAAAGRLAGAATLPAHWLVAGGALATEFAIGAAIGYLARLIFVGVELAAMHVGQQMGLALAEVFDPLKEESSEAVSRLLQLTALVVFLAIGGHRTLIAALLGTFDVLPAGLAASVSCSAAMKAAVTMLAMSFVLALKIAAPVLIAILVVTVADGLLQKTMPQVNILTVGLPVRAMLGLAVLAVSLAAMAPLLEAAVGVLTRQWAVAFPAVQ